MNSKEILGHLSQVTKEKLYETKVPGVFMSAWRTLPNGAQLSNVYTYTTRPIASPALWLKEYEKTQEEILEEAINRVRSNS